MTTVYFFLAVMFAHGNFADYRDGKELPVTSYKLKYNGEGYLFANPSICTKLLDEFADSASNFTKCSIKHARPIRLCEKCIDHYVKFRESYKNLLQTNLNGTSCETIFISHDRLEVVLNYHDNILAIWNKGNCNDCFNWTKDKPEISNKTYHFYQIFNETMQCIEDNINPKENSTKVCENCMQSYIQLNNYYESLSFDRIGLDIICMDVIDSMNATRSIWSKSLNCCKLRKSPEIIFLCCSGIIACLPVLYYIMVKYCGPIKDLPNILKQSRFKQRILRTVNGIN
ncbi:osteopetrosis-associated transmembrane protein 1 isoform X1 [Bombyx mori]|uniref:Osteopetrosis-associated transmembrane protein 1 n=1 Tax=Bombyx mori TaxID=7091 RepID=A0A8R2M546_BOMMO|nr:osteopetrosis-associated transmembrane protein 1 isoform X1 [Bombyx mori]